MSWLANKRIRIGIEVDAALTDEVVAKIGCSWTTPVVNQIVSKIDNMLRRHTRTAKRWMTIAASCKEIVMKRNGADEIAVRCTHVMGTLASRNYSRGDWTRLTASMNQEFETELHASTKGKNPPEFGLTVHSLEQFFS